MTCDYNKQTLLFDNRKAAHSAVYMRSSQVPADGWSHAAGNHRFAQWHDYYNATLVPVRMSLINTMTSEIAQLNMPIYKPLLERISYIVTGAHLVYLCATTVRIPLGHW